ncbi:MAG: hypothetical protein ACYDDA_05810 [Acidiferrobacteraceae bacterium]
MPFINDDLQNKIYTTASDLLLKKGKEYLENPGGIDLTGLLIAAGAGALAGFAGSALYEKYSLNKNQAALGQLSYQIQQLGQEVNSYRQNMPNNNNQSNNYNNNAQQFDANGNPIIDIK